MRKSIILVPAEHCDSRVLGRGLRKPHLTLVLKPGGDVSLATELGRKGSLTFIDQDCQTDGDLQYSI